MMQTLIGADQTTMTLSGRVEIFSTPDNNVVIESHPGVGLPIQRVALDGLRILDVETLWPIDHNNYPFRGPGGKA